MDPNIKIAKDSLKTALEAVSKIKIEPSYEFLDAQHDIIVGALSVALLLEGKVRPSESSLNHRNKHLSVERFKSKIRLLQNSNMSRSEKVILACELISEFPRYTMEVESFDG